MRRDIKNISQCIQIVFFWTAGTSAENEGLALQIIESREDVQLLKESKEQALRDKKAAEKRLEIKIRTEVLRRRTRSEF